MHMQGKGSLAIRLTTANMALPIAGATIRIADMYGNLIDTVFTNLSGVSPPVELPTPPVETQFDPNLTERPYNPYIVDITAAGFYETVIKGVQIYGDSSSELPIDLIEIQPSQPQRILEYDIGHNALEVCSTHQDAPPPCPVVQGEVFIPTHITVHLGTPTSSARNVTVRFVDYIKNVASSEIFPDWPYHSLRANIHAQISITLNRIYTEWYRSKGYNFDITNSTQYDQAFVENRNIFDSVSAIADEIFNSYVIRPPGTEPYFTEYCNGTTSTCPGLKQWGTVTLAGQGKNYLQILQYYYGTNIYIATTNNIQAPFESFPGDLSVGSASSYVAILQSQLTRIRQNYPKIPVTPADGVYGTQTAAAVREFQEIFGLSQTGTVNRVTWYKISYVYVAVRKLAELGSEGQPAPPETTPPTTPPSSVYPPFPGILLKIGSRGDDVRLMQTYLNTLGKRYATIPQQTVDGIFGNSMHSAVVAFQRLFGLTADGIIGRQTWDRIVTEYNNLPSVPPSQVYPPFPGYLIRQGQQGENIRLMQRYLNAIGRVYPDIPQQTEDGVFGSTMYRAVVAFQKLYNLVADGIIGRDTWNSIVSVYDNLPSVSPPQFPGTLLREGMKNDSIKLMQSYLNAIGRVRTQIPQLTVDGNFGPMTQQAVLAFQRLFGLTPDGVIGRITWDRIVQEYRKI